MASTSHGVAAFVLEDEGIGGKCGLLKKCALAAGALRAPRLVARGALLRLAPAALPPLLFPGEPIAVLAEIVGTPEPGATLELTAEYEGTGAWRDAGGPGPGRLLGSGEEALRDTSAEREREREKGAPPLPSQPRAPAA